MGHFSRHCLRSIELDFEKLIPLCTASNLNLFIANDARTSDSVTLTSIVHLLHLTRVRIPDLPEPKIFHRCYGTIFR